jgi:REP element-mobilizing transposase RayT
MIRGVERRSIFADDFDRECFLDRFERLVTELGFACDASALLGNHAHFVIETGQVPLAKLMARLGTYHALRFNRRLARAGHLFEARYKAKLVEDDGGLARAVAYVLGNPVRHRLVTLSQLAAYRWSSYGALAGARPPRKFESPYRIAEILGAEPHELIRAVALAPESADASLEPDLLEELDALIRITCARHGVPRSALHDPPQHPMRAEILGHAVRTLRVSVVQACRALGVSRASGARILANTRERRG